MTDDPSTPRTALRRPAGIVLAGGVSRRMGQDKGRIVLDGRTLVERAATLLAAVCSPVLVADRAAGTAGAWQSIPDGPGSGPAAGILGAAWSAPEASLLVLACDLPGVGPELLARLVDLSIGADLVVPRWQRTEPLCAVWGRRALEVLDRQVDGGHYALHTVLDAPGLEVRWLEGEELEAVAGAPERAFLNLNRPGDLGRWAALSGRSPSLTGPCSSGQEPTARPGANPQRNSKR